MTDGRVRTLAVASFAVSALLCAATVPFLVLAWDVPLLPTEFGVKGYAIAWSLVVGGVGAVLAARRPANSIGWIFCGLGIVSGIIALATEYARWALIDQGGRALGGLYAAWVVEWIWIPVIAALGVVAAVFPDGRFLSAGWRRVTWGAVAATLVPTVLSAVVPELTSYAGFDNPVGSGGDGVTAAAGVSTTLLFPIVVCGAAAVIRRFRHSRGEERLQLKWLALAMSLTASMFGVYGVLVLVQGTTSPEGEGPVWLALESLTILAFLAVPVSISIGVLKYRLYDIDIVINKAVVYGGLAAFVTGIYLLVVVAVGSLTGYASNPVLSGVAAGIVALAFQPARRRAQHLANRFVYGKRATPYEVLSELSSRFAGTYSLEDTLPRLARVVAEAVGAERARVWLRSDRELRPRPVRSPERCPTRGPDASRTRSASTPSPRSSAPYPGSPGSPCSCRPWRRSWRSCCGTDARTPRFGSRSDGWPSWAGRSSRRSSAGSRSMPSALGPRSPGTSRSR